MYLCVVEILACPSDRQARSLLPEDFRAAFVEGRLSFLARRPKHRGKIEPVAERGKKCRLGFTVSPRAEKAGWGWGQ